MGEQAEAEGPQRRRAHVCITTHTAERLAPTLAAAARQTSPPTAIVVSVDGGGGPGGEIREVVNRAWPPAVASLRARGETPPTLLLTERPHAGFAQPNQARNNALRALDAHVGLRDDDLIVGLDGDIVLHPTALATHIDLARAGADVISAFRINLDPQGSAQVHEQVACVGETGGPDQVAGVLDPFVTPEARADLVVRAARASRQLILRRAGLGALVKAHKPKLITAHHAVRVRALRAINGYDEAYRDYGYEDDDLARRLHRAKLFRWALGIESALAFHLHHPSRAPTRPTDAPGYARFRAPGWRVRAELGWATPGPQPEPRTAVIDAP